MADVDLFAHCLRVKHAGLLEGAPKQVRDRVIGRFKSALARQSAGTGERWFL